VYTTWRVNRVSSHLRTWAEPHLYIVVVLSAIIYFFLVHIYNTHCTRRGVHNTYSRHIGKRTEIIFSKRFHSNNVYLTFEFKINPRPQRSFDFGGVGRTSIAAPRVYVCNTHITNIIFAQCGPTSKIIAPRAKYR